MRRILIGLTLALLLVVSIGVGVTVARWPQCRHVCPWVCARCGSVTDGSSAPARGRKNRVAQRLGASIIDHL